MPDPNPLKICITDVRSLKEGEIAGIRRFRQRRQEAQCTAGAEWARGRNKVLILRMFERARGGGGGLVDREGRKKECGGVKARSGMGRQMEG